MIEEGQEDGQEEEQEDGDNGWDDNLEDEDIKIEYEQDNKVYEDYDYSDYDDHNQIVAAVDDIPQS